MLANGKLVSILKGFVSGNLTERQQVRVRAQTTKCSQNKGEMQLYIFDFNHQDLPRAAYGNIDFIAIIKKSWGPSNRHLGIRS